MILESQTHVNAPPEEVYRFFEELDRHFESWHPEHRNFRWTAGDGLAEGSEANFEEGRGKNVQRMTVRFTAVTPNRYIEFKPTGLITRIILSRFSFTIEPEPGGSLVTQRLKIRTGPIGARLNKRHLDAVRTHMDQEGENLRRIVEDRA